MNISKITKCLTAGMAAGIGAFVPLAAGATHWAIAADIGAAIAAGVFAAVTTYVAPANKSANKPDGDGTDGHIQ